MWDPGYVTYLSSPSTDTGLTHGYSTCYTLSPDKFSHHTTRHTLTTSRPPLFVRSLLPVHYKITKKKFDYLCQKGVFRSQPALGLVHCCWWPRKTACFASVVTTSVQHCHEIGQMVAVTPHPWFRHQFSKSLPTTLNALLSHQILVAKGDVPENYRSN